MRGYLYLATFVATAFCATAASAVELSWEADGDLEAVTGDVTYAGGNAPLIGTNVNIAFVQRDDGTNGSTTCMSCLLQFDSGPLQSQDGTIYVWDGPGSFTITGDYDGAGPATAATVMAQGSVGNTTGMRDNSSEQFFINFSDLDLVTVDPGVQAFFGIDPMYAGPIWEGLGSFSFGTDDVGVGGGFTNEGRIAAVDFHVAPSVGPNPNDVPAPAAIGLFGLGLASLGFARRRRNG